MKRRGFIKIVAAGSCFAFYPAVFSGCTPSATSQNLKSPATQETDIRLKLISYGMLAPNSHNIQPWLVKLTGAHQFDLFVDQTRLLPETDPPSRQIHISQGTFLETLKIAASGLGYRVEVETFPLGQYSNMTIEDKPVASIYLTPDAAVQQDPLFPYLQSRQSNKRVYGNRKIPREELAQLQQNSQENGLATIFSDSPRVVEGLGSMLGKAMDIETAGPDRHRETVDIFRFSEAEALEKRDGFTLGNNGVTGLMRFLVETFFLGTREKAYATDSAFATEGVKMAYKQAASASAYGWIISKSNTRLSQVRSGELYTRINLLTASLGISQHPMSQVLEEYEDMKELQRECLILLRIPAGSTVQMLFRLGYADPVPHTRRRFAKEVIA
ncbi:twin-arginine translocation pathway signal protein [bacterium]|nr:twin-arginine translocation pathway signal protein [bacterium]